ncbi:hypothetical protein FKM82_010795 [Ascaphus truei]
MCAFHCIGHRRMRSSFMDTRWTAHAQILERTTIAFHYTGPRRMMSSNMDAAQRIRTLKICGGSHE